MSATKSERGVPGSSVGRSFLPAAKVVAFSLWLAELRRVSKSARFSGLRAASGSVCDCLVANWPMPKDLVPIGKPRSGRRRLRETNFSRCAFAWLPSFSFDEIEKRMPQQPGVCKTLASRADPVDLSISSKSSAPNSGRLFVPWRLD